MVTMFIKFGDGHAVAILEQKIVRDRCIIETIKALGPQSEIAAITPIPPVAVPQTHLTLFAAHDMEPEQVATLARKLQRRIDNCGKLADYRIGETNAKNYHIYWMLTNFKNTSALFSFLSGLELDDMNVLRRDELPKEFFVENESEDE